MPGQDQLLILTTANTPQIGDYQFWLLTGLESSAGPAVSIGGHLDPRLQPLYAADPYLVLSSVSATADLDGDGADEALFVMSADDKTHCGLVIVDATSRQRAEISARDPVVLDEPCPHPQLLPVDVDGDGHVDVALLTGGSGYGPGYGPVYNDRRLLVLWNDGAGGFAPSQVTVVSAEGESPQQFTVLPTPPGRPFSFAYVTDRAVVRVTTSADDSRAFAPPEVLADSPGGTGIAAADLNGDGVPDLALAASGNLRILKARLAPP
jgi:hypothetical protein